MSTIEQSCNTELKIERKAVTQTAPGSIQQTWPPAPTDTTPVQLMQIQETANGIQFWHDPEEDIYDLEDGEPI